MPKIVFLACLLLGSFVWATVPLPLVGTGCDDEDPRDGYIDVISDCPNDLTRCTHHTGKTSCLDDKHCSWKESDSTCEGADWDLVSFVGQRWHARLSDQGELAIGSGIHADRAWQREVGRFDTVIAVLDSGIEWHDKDLQNKHYLNRNELPVPRDANDTDCGRDADTGRVACPEADPYDCNGDCVFNVQDYSNDARVDATMSNAPNVWNCLDPYNYASSLPVENTILEPADLLCAFADGVDGYDATDVSDQNGYVDDISGWDFLWDDPNPYDDTLFGHGTGEAHDSASEVNNGMGLPGICPNCSVMSIRAGDSFVVDSTNWAAGIVFAVDTGAKVLQSAVGALNNSSFSQAAIEYAYDRGVINIISAADETAQHQNYPGAVRHAEYVHAVRFDKENLGQATTFLNFSNCTNFGARLTLSAPTTGCSSGATGAISGIGGLVASAAQNHIDTGGLGAAEGSRTGLRGNEIHQIFIQAVDDINVPMSQPDHADYDPLRYPSKEGWDMYFGYGRSNARKAVDIILDAEIPPIADIWEPRWFDLRSPKSGTIDITGQIAAPRDTVASWVLDYAVGVQPDVTDGSLWVEVAKGSAADTNFGLSESVPGGGSGDGYVLGRLDPTTIESFDPAARIEAYNTVPEKGAVDTNVSKSLKVNRYTVTLRLRVTDSKGRVAEDRRALYIHDDDTLKEGFPLRLGVSGESSPTLFDLNADGALEIVFGDADGQVHAFQADGTELLGWPVSTQAGRTQNHANSWAFTHGPDGIEGNGDELKADVASAIVATVAIGDVLGQGEVAVVAGTLDGELYAWDTKGAILTGFPVDVTAGVVSNVSNDDAFIERGIFASPVLEDLDGDEAHDIIVATLDQRVVAYHGSGEMLKGFPVEGGADPTDPTKPILRLVYDINKNPDGQIRRIVSTPAVGDLDGDGNLEIVVGTNEAIDEQYSVLYAFTYDRSAQDTVAYGRTCGTPEAQGKNCWPITMIGAYPNALPYVGQGTPASPILADLDGDGTLEIAASSIAEITPRIYRHDGYNSVNSVDSAFLELKSGYGFYGLGSNSEQASSLVMVNSGAFGDVDQDGALDYFIGAAGANFVDNLLKDGERADFDHQVAGWSTKSGSMLKGFPQIVEDLQFFLNPLLADVDGDGGMEVINTSGTFVVHAFKEDGTQPDGWPKFTGHWQLATPAVGDIDGDGFLEVVVLTRAGFLFVYETLGLAKGPVAWSSFHHDSRNTGNYHTTDPTITTVGQGCACSSEGDAASAWWVLVALCPLRRKWRRS
jgi:MYXO-CTERM domain-containing protein